jgi:tape measure domain-containing protein
MRLAGSGVGASMAVQIDPIVNDQAVTRADQQLNRLLDKGVEASKEGNLELAQDVEKYLSKYTGKVGKAEIVTRFTTVVDENGNRILKAQQGIITENIAALQKQRQVNANSVTSLRQQVNTLKQQRDLLNPIVQKVDNLGKTYAAINPEISEKNEKIKQTEELLRRAQGIQKGSISDIQTEIRLLEQKKAKMASIASLPAGAPGTGTVQVMNPEMKEVTAELEKQQALLREAQGIQKGSVADLEAEVALIKEKARASKNTVTYQDKYGNSVEKTVEMNEADEKILREKESALRKAKGIQEGSKVALQEQLAIAIKQRDNTSRLINITDKYGKVIKQKLNPEWEKSNKNVLKLDGQIKKLDASTGGLGGKVGRFAAGLGKVQLALQGVLMAQQAVNAAVGAFVTRQKQIQALQLTFEGIGVGLQGQEAILKSAAAVSLTYGQSLTKVEGAYKRLGPAIQQAGGSLSDTQLAIETIAARTTQLGLNTEQTGRYIEAFAQVLGKGKLQGEELNQQFAELDGALRGQLQSYIEATYGITDFTDAMQAGEVTGQMFLDSMIAIGEEARGKIAKDMDELSQSIARIGEEGGPTIQQLQNQLATLSTIGLTEVGKTLGEFGKSLMSIQSAFVQVFTKVATEMPMIQQVFKSTFGAIGTILELAVNGLTLLFGVIMRDIERFLGFLSKIPGMQGIFKGLTDGVNGLKDDLRLAVDDFSKLDEATTGSLRVIREYENELQTLRAELDAGGMSVEESTEKLARYQELLAKKTAAEAAASEKQLSDQYESTRQVLADLIEKKKEQLAVEEAIANRKISVIEETDRKDKEAYDEEVARIKERGNKYREAIDEKIRATQDFFSREKQLISDSIDAQRAYGQEMKSMFGNAINAVQQYYASLKQAEESRHKQAISNINAEIAKVKEKYASEISSLDSGPQQEKLEFMNLQQLRKQARTAESAYDRQRARAQIESIQNAKRKAQLEREQAEELKALEEEKAQEEQRNAEEKARLDAEEKARKEALAEADRQVQKDILNSLQILAGQKKDLNAEEKKQVKELKEERKRSDKEQKDALTDLKKARDANHKARMNQIDKIKSALKKEREAVEDVEIALKKLPAAAKTLESAVDYVTNGALERQLQKVLRIKRELANSKSGGGGGGDNAINDSNIRENGGILESDLDSFASGGPVTGGTEYMVNELGREGFVSSSGKISEITAPAFGTWRAPAMGTIIPAHIWENYKEAKKAIKPNLSSTPAPVSGSSDVPDALSKMQNSGVIKEILQNNDTILPIETREKQKASKKQPRFKLPTLKNPDRNKGIEKNLENYKEKEIRKQEESYKKEELKVNTPVFGSLKAPSGSTEIPAYVWSEVKQPRRSSGALSSKGSIGVSSSSVTNVNNINKSKSASSSSNTVYNNSVTVQSSNPTQTANNMLVELTKIRRQRMGR